MPLWDSTCDASKPTPVPVVVPKKTRLLNHQDVLNPKLRGIQGFEVWEASVFSAFWPLGALNDANHASETFVLFTFLITLVEAH